MGFMKKPVKKKIAKKPVVVNRKFLARLANRIYNPADRTFLRLCNGTLQNGPDPTDERRPMHCGLGELYFAMTGKHPDEDVSIDEEKVVNLAVELSPLAGLREKAVKDEEARFEKAEAAIQKLDLSDDAKMALVDALNYVDREHSEYVHEDDRDDAEHYFRVELDSIPTANDDDKCGDNKVCKVTDYRARSRRVAAKLRRAADFLPS